MGGADVAQQERGQKGSSSTSVKEGGHNESAVKGDFDRYHSLLEPHFEMVRKKNHLKCKVCGRNTVWKCRVCDIPLCVFETIPRVWTGGKCMFKYHNAEFFGL